MNEKPIKRGTIVTEIKTQRKGVFIKKDTSLSIEFWLIQFENDEFISKVSPTLLKGNFGYDKSRIEQRVKSSGETQLRKL